MKALSSLLAVVALTIGLFGCGTTISTSPVQDIRRGPIGDVIARGINDANFNLQSAIEIKVLPSNDPAAGCLKDIQTKLGIDPNKPAPPSFEARVSELISAGSVGYIRLHQLRQLQLGGLGVSVECQALLGKLIIDAAEDARRLAPGGGLLGR